MGLEPTSGGTTILCLNHLATLAVPINYHSMDFCDRSSPLVNIRYFFRLSWNSSELRSYIVMYNSRGAEVGAALVAARSRGE